MCSIVCKQIFQNFKMSSARGFRHDPQTGGHVIVPLYPADYAAYRLLYILVLMIMPLPPNFGCALMSATLWEI